MKVMRQLKEQVMSKLQAIEYYIFEKPWRSQDFRELSVSLRTGLIIFPFIFIGLVFRERYDNFTRAVALIWCFFTLSLMWSDFELYLETLDFIFITTLIFESLALLLYWIDSPFDKPEWDTEMSLGMILCPAMFLPALIRLDIPKVWKCLLLPWCWFSIGLIEEHVEFYYKYVAVIAGIFSLVLLFNLMLMIKKAITFLIKTEQELELEQRMELEQKYEVVGNLLDKKLNYSIYSYGSEVREWIKPRIKALQDKFDNFWQVLDAQFAKDEITYSRYKEIVGELYITAQTQVEQLFVLKYSIIHIEGSKSNKASKLQLTYINDINEKIASVLAVIEQMKTKLSVLAVNLGTIDTCGSETTKTFDKAIKETQELIDRIDRYDVRNT